jgi:hypothetical protein
MKKTNVLIMGAMFALIGCGVNPSTEERSQAIEDSIMEIVHRHDHEIDSIKKRQRDIVDLIEVGYEPERATFLIDSAYKVAANIK